MMLGRIAPASIRFLGTVHEPSQLGEYSGGIHHYNLTASKIDCGGFELNDVIRKIKKIN